MILEPTKIKSDTVSTVSPSISHEVINEPNKNAEPGVRRADVIQHSYREGHFNSNVLRKRLRGWRQEDPFKNSGSMPDEA